MKQLTNEEKVATFNKLMEVIDSFDLMGIIEDRSLAFWFHMELYKIVKDLDLERWELDEEMKKNNVYLKD